MLPAALARTACWCATCAVGRIAHARAIIARADAATAAADDVNVEAAWQPDAHDPDDDDDDNGDDIDEDIDGAGGCCNRGA